MRLIPLLLAAIPLTALAQTAHDATVVVVNGEPIGGATYIKRMEVLPGVGQLVNDRFVPGSPGFLTLSKLINERLILQLARQKGVSPTPAEVDREVARRVEENPELLKAIQAVGFTSDDFKYDTTVQLAEFKLLTMGVNITDLEVEKFYKDNPSSFTIPRRYRLRAIIVAEAAARDLVDTDLKAGKPFDQVARERSVDVTKVEGGLVGNVPEAALGPVYGPAVREKPKGHVTPWIEQEGGFLKLLVEDVLAQQTIPLDAKLRMSVRRNLMLDRGRVRNDLSAMMTEFRKAAKIEYQGTPFDTQLKQAFGG